MEIRDRIKALRRVKAAELQPHPKNWRTHPQAQRDALRGVLAEIGFADALLARELPDGTLQLIDGHLRAEITPEAEVPVLVVDLDDQEAAKLLALLDPLAGLAETDQDILADLLADVTTDDEAVQTLLDDLLAEANEASKGAVFSDLQTMEVKRPPRITWVLIGIPTVRFGEIAEMMDLLAQIDGVVLESTYNDGDQDG